MDAADLVVTVREATEDAKKARKGVRLANSLLHSAAAWEEVVEVPLKHSFILGSNSMCLERPEAREQAESTTREGIPYLHARMTLNPDVRGSEI